jgi:DNA processing protein
MEKTELQYLIALTQVEGIGPIVGKELLNFFGSAQNIFNESQKALKTLKRVGPALAESVAKKNTLVIAERELAFIEKHNISTISISESDYPNNLINCIDSPILLFYKGNGPLNEKRSVSVVGTRECTSYGRDFVEQLIDLLAGKNIAVHSGLAYGIDITAHKHCLDKGVPTYCSLAHGFDRIYPHRHRGFANQILEEGGWITEFLSGTIPDRENFPKRNRIVAGISQATIVVESARKGGSLITADLANAYGRDVFALPGRVTDAKSAGCNFLIKTNRAHLLETPQDFLYLMNWDSEKPKAVQFKMFENLSVLENCVVQVIQDENSIGIDDLAEKLEKSMSELSTALLLMEFNGIVRQLPGKMYEMA